MSTTYATIKAARKALLAAGEPVVFNAADVKAAIHNQIETVQEAAVALGLASVKVAEAIGAFRAQQESPFPVEETETNAQAAAIAHAQAMETLADETRRLHKLHYYLGVFAVAPEGDAKKS